MQQTYCRRLVGLSILAALFCLWLGCSISHAEDAGKGPQGPPPAPVKVASVIEEQVSEQITLIGTTEAIARSMVAA